MPKGKYQKVIGSMKDKLGEKIMKDLAELRAKSFSYLIEDKNENKKAKGTKKSAVH